MGRFTGDQIAKIPDKAIKIDDKLIEKSDQISKRKIESVEEMMAAFTDVEDSGIRMFAETINLVNRMHNETMIIVG